ncbi:hypothetical protein IWZ00DRAFT_484310 [Phyllosticta capitalensis]|uniref:Uncharacterized protein n=1 Tax=Phyllosticta capitalensis TaxID=121624 RepID=A0ABR1Z1G6_9PEZI
MANVKQQPCRSPLIPKRHLQQQVWHQVRQVSSISPQDELAVCHEALVSLCASAAPQSRQRHDGRLVNDTIYFTTSTTHQVSSTSITTMSPPSNNNAQRSNPTQLGDPVSLKAETSNTSHYRGARSTWTPNQATPSKTNKTMLGDPVSLKAEKGNHRDPVDHDNGPSGNPGASQRMSRL